METKTIAGIGAVVVAIGVGIAAISVKSSSDRRPPPDAGIVLDASQDLDAGAKD